MREPSSEGRNNITSTIVIATAWACFGVGAALIAQTRSSPISSKPAVAKPAEASTTSPAVNSEDATKYRAMVDKYCVGCHNNRTASPSEDPVILEGAGFDDLLSHAGTWERVIRKLSVRAMPPPGMPRPSEAEYAGFANWLATSLDRAWEGKSTPGRYVVHRLNRTEYANTVRDLLAVDIDVSDILPTDGADFGFDNIATALKTSPLLLEAYVNAAQRVSRDGCGRSAGQARYDRAFRSAREFSQNGYTLTAFRWERSAAPSSITFFRRTARVQSTGPVDPRRGGRLLRRGRKRYSLHLCHYQEVDGNEVYSGAGGRGPKGS